MAHISLKTLCVTQRSNRFYYPKSIPRERSLLTTKLLNCIVFMLFLFDLFTSKNNVKTVIAHYVLGLMATIVLELLYRFILTIEETNHLISRYDGHYMNLIKDAFQFNKRVWIVFVLCVIYIVYYFCSNNFLTNDQFNICSVIIYQIPSTYFLAIVLQLSSCPLNDSLWIAQNNGLDYGSGMAYSFYHGYLKLVLSKTGPDDKNIMELMQNYEDRNRIKFDVYKLFVLIPKSLNCFTSLKNDYCPSVDESSSLPEKVITVAGVQNRVYKNAVYKIIPERTNKKVYVSAEYATPLRTFKEVVIDFTGVHSDYYEKHKDDIILQFYLTLKKILEKTGLYKYCELIYYEDYYKDQENHIHYYDVGKIILTRLKELRKFQQEKVD